jgi:predicted permease
MITKKNTTNNIKRGFQAFAAAFVSPVVVTVGLPLLILALVLTGDEKNQAKSLLDIATMGACR